MISVTLALADENAAYIQNKPTQSPMKSLIYFKSTKRLQFQSNKLKTKPGNSLLRT